MPKYPPYPSHVNTLPAYRGVSDEPGYYEVDREQIQEPFSDMLDHMKCDYHGHAERYEDEDTDELVESALAHYIVEFDSTDPMRHYVIDTPLFTLRPFYWGENDDVYRLPNFVYKPWSLTINWYKYPLRDAHTNCQLYHGQWFRMIDTCKAFYDALETGTLDTFEYPAYDDRRSSADVWADIWSQRCNKLSKAADNYYSALDFIYMGIADNDPKFVQDGLDIANEHVDMTLDAKPLSLEHIERDGDTITLKLHIN